jgi:uncharacterized protein
LAWVVGLLFSIFHWVPPIFGFLATLNNPNETYRYPFIWRLLLNPGKLTWCLG